MNLRNDDKILTKKKFQEAWSSKFLFTGVIVMAICFFAYAIFITFEPYSSNKPSDSLNLTTSYEQIVELPELPMKLIIPSIGVDASIQYVGLVDNGTGEMDVPDNFTDVGWYKHGPRPGMVGSAVIAGHLNGKNVAQAVFFDLKDLEIGDRLSIIDTDDTALTFEVVKVRTFNHDDVTDDVFISTDGKIKLNLITCAGDWLSNEELYNQRTVVFTELVSNSN